MIMPTLPKLKQPCECLFIRMRAPLFSHVRPNFASDNRMRYGPEIKRVSHALLSVLNMVHASDMGSVEVTRMPLEARRMPK